MLSYNKPNKQLFFIYCFYIYKKYIKGFKMFPMFGINLNSMMSGLPQTPEFQNGSAFGFNGYNMNPAFNQKNIHRSMINIGPSSDVYGRPELRKNVSGNWFLGITTTIINIGVATAAILSLFSSKK